MNIHSKPKQEIFNLSIKYGVHLFIAASSILLLGFFDRSKVIENLLISTLILIGAPLLFWLWYRTIGMGPGEKGIAEVKQEGTAIILSQYGEVNTFDLGDVKSYFITGKVFRVVTIVLSSEKSIKFVYYMFSSQQRKAIFNLLSGANRGPQDDL